MASRKLELHSKNSVLRLENIDSIIGQVREMLKGNYSRYNIIVGRSQRTYEDCTIRAVGSVLDNKVRVLVFEDKEVPRTLQVTIRSSEDHSSFY